jgi:DNA-binding winged helix-turn-helix (wHTH) protein/tetratricopeptide (TPR) repeat protein
MGTGHHLYEFGPYRLDAAEYTLVRDGCKILLTPKAFETLLVLVENTGHVVDKEELLKRIWPETFVEEGTLAQNVFTLRKLLGRDAAGNHYIETVPKRGYRFAGPTKVLLKPPTRYTIGEGFEPPGSTARVPQPLRRAVAAILSVVVLGLLVWFPVRLLTARRNRAAAALRHSPPVDSEAHDAYLHGRLLLLSRPNTSREDLTKSIALFQRAIEKDPTFALGYVGLGEGYGEMSFRGYLPKQEGFEKMKAAALKALELDATLGEPHEALGQYYLAYMWDLPSAGREFRQATQLSPNYPDGHQGYSEYLMITGQLEAGVEEMKRATELAPYVPEFANGFVQALYLARRYDQAIEQSRRTLELDPGSMWAHMLLGQLYLQKSGFHEAITEFEKVGTIAPADTVHLGFLGYAYALAGRKRQARKILESCKEHGKRRLMPDLGFALVYVGLGEKDQAIDWLEKAFQQRENAVLGLGVYPLVDPLRSEPRFQELLRHVGLTDGTRASLPRQPPGN